MRVGTRVSGSAIDRVFSPSMVPARRFRSATDAALTLALGSVCAFGLTLGPAPMNTVALSAPASSSPDGLLDPEADAALVPDEIGAADSDTKLPGATYRPRLPASADSPETANPSAKSPPPPAAQPPRPKQPPTPQPLPPPPAPAPPNESAGPGILSQDTPLSVVERYRVASGFGAFVATEDCTQPTVYQVVKVTPSMLFPPGLGKKSLAPDPAYATVGEGPGAVAVTIHTCE